MSDRSFLSPSRFLPILIGLPIGIVVFEIWQHDTMSRHQACVAWAKVQDQALLAAHAAATAGPEHQAGLDNLEKLSGYLHDHPDDPTPSDVASKQLGSGIEDVQIGVASEQPDRTARGMSSMHASADAFGDACRE